MFSKRNSYSLDQLCTVILFLFRESHLNRQLLELEPGIQEETMFQ